MICNLLTLLYLMLPFLNASQKSITKSLFLIKKQKINSVKIKISVKLTKSHLGSFSIQNFKVNKNNQISFLLQKSLK